MEFLRHRYEHPKKQRYYILTITPDLFGGVHLDQIFGGLGKTNTRQKSEWFDNYDEALSRFQQEHDRRMRGHYELVEN